MTAPRVLLIDQPTDGLAPQVSAFTEARGRPRAAVKTGLGLDLPASRRRVMNRRRAVLGLIVR
jgi:hypothetical protein